MHYYTSTIPKVDIHVTFNELLNGLVDMTRDIVNDDPHNFSWGDHTYLLDAIAQRNFGVIKSALKEDGMVFKLVPSLAADIKPDTVIDIHIYENLDGPVVMLVQDCPY